MPYPCQSQTKMRRLSDTFIVSTDLIFVCERNRSAAAVLMEGEQYSDALHREVKNKGSWRAACAIAPFL